MVMLYFITGTINKNIDIGLLNIPYDANVYLVIEAFRKSFCRRYVHIKYAWFYSHNTFTCEKALLGLISLLPHLNPLGSSCRIFSFPELVVNVNRNFIAQKFEL